MLGRIRDNVTEAPILDAVIVADGIITFPTGDGLYELNIRPGKHQAIVYLLDGSYRTQSKIIQVDQQSELNFELEKAKPAKVKIKIEASPPPFHRVRVYTSAEQTGMRFLYQNRFLTEDYKELDKEIELNLYEDQPVDYLYTVGNPAVSFENKKGEHVIRNFIAKDGLVVEDKLGSFLHDNSKTLTVKVPEYTDPNDVIGLKDIHLTILFMHNKGNNEWVLSLGGELGTDSEYRYFKTFSGQGDEKTQKRKLGSKRDMVESWKFQAKEREQVSVSVPSVKNKFDIFIYPFDYYSPGMVMQMEPLINRISNKGFRGIVLSQIWGYESLDPPKTSRHKPSTLYISLFELKRLSKLAHDKGLKVSLFPQLVGAESLLGESNEKTFDQKWWEAWLKEMENFNMYNARTAEAAGIESLIFQSRQPGMNLPQEYKKTYSQRQKEIIAKMREAFHGKIIAPADWEEEGKEIDYWKYADIVSQKI